MTTTDRFDVVVAGWLRDNGPADIRPAALEAALEVAARKPQHRGLRLLLDWAPAPRLRVAVAVALASLVVAGMLLAIGGPPPPPVVPTASPSSAVPTERPSPSTALPTPSVATEPPLGAGGWINVSQGSDIHVLSPDGALDRSINAGHASCPRLSPDGQEVGYVLRFSGMYATLLADGTTRKVGTNDTSNTSGYREGVWSPDHARLAFLRPLAPEGFGLHVVAVFADEPSTRMVFGNPTGDLSEAAWSADSRLIAVAHVEAGERFISILDLTGTVRQEIGPVVAAPGTNMTLAWSPDATRLAYIEWGAVTPRVGVIDVASGTVGAASFAGGADFRAESPWSADGRWLALVGSDGNLQIAPAEGGTVVDGPGVELDPNEGYLPRWSPTASIVAVRTPTGLMTVAVADGERTELATFNDPTRWAFDWSPDGSRIVIAEDRGSGVGLVVSTVDATGGSAPVELATYPADRNAAICLSWDLPTAP